jgi:hypothetical protein
MKSVMVSGTAAKISGGVWEGQVGGGAGAASAQGRRQIISATGWQAHTVHEFITGTRGKKKWTPTIESIRRGDGGRVYHIVGATAVEVVKRLSRL